MNVTAVCTSELVAVAVHISFEVQIFRNKFGIVLNKCSMCFVVNAHILLFWQLS